MAASAAPGIAAVPAAPTALAAAASVSAASPAGASGSTTGALSSTTGASASGASALPVRLCVLTVSDRVSRSLAEDRSGPEACRMAAAIPGAFLAPAR